MLDSRANTFQLIIQLFNYQFRNPSELWHNKSMKNIQRALLRESKCCLALLMLARLWPGCFFFFTDHRLKLLEMHLLGVIDQRQRECRSHPGKINNSRDT